MCSCDRRTMASSSASSSTNTSLLSSRTSAWRPAHAVPRDAHHRTGVRGGGGLRSATRPRRSARRHPLPEPATAQTYRGCAGNPLVVRRFQQVAHLLRRVLDAAMHLEVPVIELGARPRRSAALCKRYAGASPTRPAALCEQPREGVAQTARPGRTTAVVRLESGTLHNLELLGFRCVEACVPALCAALAHDVSGARRACRAARPRVPRARAPIHL